MDASKSLIYDAGNTKSVLCDNIEGWDGEGGKKGFQGEKTYIYLGLIHVDVQQKPSQYC